MRVIAGSARGRALVAPDGAATRPTTDRVREATFNALFSLDDPVAGAHVLDLFAGSGALGIEALSRGAASATFVERSRPAATVIEQNLRRTGVADRAEIVRADAFDWLRRTPGRYDLVLCDPPYDFADWATLLDALGAVSAPDALAVLESDRELDTGPDWEVIRSRRYGGTVVSIVRRRPPA
jgi:16S rRNA (guanine966-N2)-methyltransferase